MVNQPLHACAASLSALDPANRKHPLIASARGRAKATTAALIAGLATGIWAGGVAACPLPTPAIQVRNEAHQPVAVDETQSIAELTRRAPRRPQERSVGLYSGEISIEVSLQPQYQQLGKTGCVGAQQVTVTVRLVNPRIWIAREFATRACIRDVVLRHEIIHLRIDETLLREWIEPIRAAVAAAVPVPGTEVRSRAEAEGVLRGLQGRVRMAARSALDRLQAERTRLNARHDSIAEYTRVRQACGNQPVPPSWICAERPDLCQRLDRP